MKQNFLSKDQQDWKYQEYSTAKEKGRNQNKLSKKDSE